MSQAHRVEIQEKDIVGLKHFDQLGGLLEQLHDVGCERIVRATERCTWISTAC